MRPSCRRSPRPYRSTTASTNARASIYHRSYEEREPVEVRITPHEIAVLSFPGPDCSIRLEQLRVGYAVSRRYRNRLVGEFLEELDLTEGRSTGIPKILNAMRNNGSPLPTIESADDRIALVARLSVHPDAADLLRQIMESKGNEGVTPAFSRRAQRSLSHSS